VSGTEKEEHLHLGDLMDPQLRQEQLGRAAVLKWNPNANTSTHTPHQRYSTPTSTRRSPTSPTRAIRFSGSNDMTPTTNTPNNVRSTTGSSSSNNMSTSLNTSSKNHREKIRHRTYSKDIVQQVIDFEQQETSNENIVLSDSMSMIQSPLLPNHQPKVQEEDDSIFVSLQVRQRVKEMENTINQLQMQKEELVRNQVEFDKHADDIFPSLEKISLQLSQIVQNPTLAMSQVKIQVT
jgi:hypothetical protein